MNNTQRHIDELYKTGKTTFRDDQLVHKDYVVEFNDLVASWSLVNTSIIIEVARNYNAGIKLSISVKEFVSKELKQLCIDYYGEE